MAHDITKFDEVVTLEKAWHGLERIEKVIEFDNSGLNYEVLSCPLFFQEGEEMKEFLGNQAIIAKKGDLVSPLATPRNSYTIIQNKTVWEVLENALDGVKHKVVSSGSVQGGAKTFISVEIAGTEWKATNGEKHKTLLNFTNSHNGTLAFEVAGSDVRIVCANTLNFHLATKKGVAKLYHSKNSAAKIEGMEMTIAAMFDAQEEFSALCERLGNEKVTENQARFFFHSLFGSKDEAGNREIKRVDEMVAMFKRGIGNKGENRHDLLNASTEYFTHHNNSKKTPEAKMRNFMSANFASNVNSGAARKMKAVEVLSNQELFEQALKEGERLLTGELVAA